MVKLRPWQWVILTLPLVLIISFIVIAAGLQIHAWGLNWLWAVIVLVLVGWRWLLALWTRPTLNRLEAQLTKAKEQLVAEVEATTATGASTAVDAEAALEKILAEAKDDPPLWEDWNPFWQRCR
jgi:Flp pilus assembly protein TadB